MCSRATLILILVCASPALSQTAAQEARTGRRAPLPCGEAAATDRVAAVSADGEISLASGRIVRLADLRWPEAPAVREARLS